MKCHCLPLTYWSWQSFENGKGEAEEEEWEGGCERNTVSAEYLLLWDKEGENAGGKMLQIQSKVFEKQVEMSFLFFLFFFQSGFTKKFVLEEKFNKIILSVFT